MRFAKSLLLLCLMIAPGIFTGAMAAPILPGSGSGDIHILPTLSSTSVKNGQKVTISAVITSQRPLREVIADMGGAATIQLRPAPAAAGGMAPKKGAAQTARLYTAEWTGRGLTEKIYTVAICATDISGRTHTDRSLRFSDPAAGVSSVGNAGYPSDQPRRLSSITAATNENNFTCAVIDVANRYAYFGASVSPGRIIRVQLNDSAPPTFAGSLVLNTGENQFGCAVIDTASGFAYFANNTSPGRIVKINLATFTRVGSIPLANTPNPVCALLDPVNGFAYFANGGSPSRVAKVNLSTFTEVGTGIALSANAVACGVIDPANGYAYYGTNSGPGRVVRMSLNGAAAPAESDVITLADGTNDINLRSAMIDTAAGFAYFSTNSAALNGRLVKINIDPANFAYVSSSANTGNGNFLTAVIDPEGAYGYTINNSNPTVMVRWALYTGGNAVNAPQRLNHGFLNTNENAVQCSVLDTQTGCVYLGTSRSPGQIVQVQLPPSDTPRREAALTVAAASSFRTAVVDTANGYAYFGTNSAPASIVKVKLGEGITAPSVVGTLALEAGENNLRSSIIDANSGYAYFGTGTAPGKVIKVALGAGDAPPTRIGALDLEPGEIDLMAAGIDADNGYGYFGTNTSPGIVVKVALGTTATLSSRIGAVTLDADEDNLRSAIVDAANGYAYFGTNTSPGKVVKIALGGTGAPSRVATLTLDPGENYLVSAALDNQGTYGYFGTNTAPGYIVRVELGDGAAAPARVGALPAGADNIACITVDKARALFYGSASAPGRVGKADLAGKTGFPAALTAQSRTAIALLETGEDALSCAVADSDSGYAYFATNTSPARVIKVLVAPPHHFPVRREAIELPAGQSWIRTGAIDTVNNCAYYATESSPAKIIKVKLNGVNPPTHVGTLTLETGANLARTILMDDAAGYAYIGTYSTPAKVVKVKLNGSTMPEVVGTLDLPGEPLITCGAIDPGNAAAYFGTESNPGIIVKVNLGAGDAAPTRDSALTLGATQGQLKAAAIDAPKGYVYFIGLQNNTNPAYIAKVALASFAVSSSLNLATADTNPTQALIDSAADLMYVTTNYVNAGAIVKINLNGAAAPTRQGTVSGSFATTPQQESTAIGALRDPASGHFYLGFVSSPANVVKLYPGGANYPVRIGGAQLNGGEASVGPYGSIGLGLVQDPASGDVFYGTHTNPARIGRVSLSHKGAVRATKIALAEGAQVTDLRFYSHKAAGNVRLALYNNESPRRLLWQSGSVANTAASDWLTVAIAAGSPSSLHLAPGQYWLAWQSDSTDDVAAYARGAYGEGLVMPQAFGAFAGTIADEAIRLTADRWSMYMTYGTAAVEELQVASAHGTPDPAVGATAYAAGSEVTASVSPATVAGGAGERFVCTGWTGTGSVPASGAGNSATFTINAPSAISWQWKTQYELTTVADPAAGGTVTLSDGTTPADGWHDSGAVVELRANPAAGYAFQGWSGGATGTANPTAVTLDAAITVTATFADGTAPSGTVSINAGAAYANSQSVTLALSASDSGPVMSGVDAMRLSNDGTNWSAWEPYATSKAWALAAGDGAKTVHAQFRDGAGNISPAATDDITLDTAAPSGTVSINSGAAQTVSKNVTLTLSAGDGAGSGVADMSFSNDGSNWSAWEPYAASKAWALSDGDGAKTVHALFRDGAGNVSSPAATDDIALDTAAPSGSLSIIGGAAYSSATLVSLALTADDGAGSGVADMRFSNDGSNWSVWEPFAATKAWTLSSGDGAKTVYAQLRDSAGNISAPALSAAISLDTAPPSSAVTAPTGTKTSPSLLVQWSASDSGAGASGIHSVSIFWRKDGGAYALLGAYPPATTSAPFDAAANGGDGVYDFYSIARDTAGNLEDAPAAPDASTTVTLDATIPAIAPEPAFTAGTTNTLSWGASADAATYTVQCSTAADFASLVASATVDAPATEHTFSGLADGALYFYRVRALTTGAYTSAWSDVVSSRQDAAAPDSAVLILTPDSLDAAYTPTAIITAELTSNDPGFNPSGTVLMRLSNDGADWSPWETYAATKPWALTAGDGPKTLFAQFRDAAGNESAVAQDQVILDTSAPAATVAINAGDPFTSVTAVSLAIGGSDPLAPVLQMRVSASGVVWSDWEAFAPARAFTLGNTDEGLQPAHVQVRDAAGNISPAASDTILLDTTAPSGTLAINGGAAFSTATLATLHFEPQADASGIAMVRMSNNGADWSPWETYAPAKGWTLEPGEGERAAYAQLRDGAGNASADLSDTIEIDFAPRVLPDIADATSRSVTVTFNEPVTGADVPGNYTLSGAGRGTVAEQPSSVEALGGNGYRLVWADGRMTNGEPITITIGPAVTDARATAIDPAHNTASGIALPVTLSRFRVE